MASVVAVLDPVKVVEESIELGPEAQATGLVTREWGLRLARVIHRGDPDFGTSNTPPFKPGEQLVIKCKHRWSEGFPADVVRG